MSGPYSLSIVADQPIPLDLRRHEVQQLLAARTQRCGIASGSARHGVPVLGDPEALSALGAEPGETLVDERDTVAARDLGRADRQHGAIDDDRSAATIDTAQLHAAMQQ